MTPIITHLFAVSLGVVLGMFLCIRRRHDPQD